MPDELYRYITAKERDAIPSEDFAWPDAPDGPEYPIDTQEHLDSAAKLLGHAPKNKQASIKARAIKIAKRHGFTLPKSWVKEKQEGKSMNKSNEPDIVRLEDLPTELELYLPIARVNKEKREVTVRATSEALDSYKTIFDFDASQDAFSRWKGNIREMHDSKKAVGRSLRWEPVPDERAIDVTLHVSKGAQDTWEKVLDGTLAGASVGARNGVWEKRMIDGEEIPVLTRYDLVEVSLVDNPANPDCTVQLVRADGMATDVVAAEDENEPLPPAAEVEPEANAGEEVQRTEEPEDTRAGSRISHATQDELHSIRDGHMSGLKKTMNICRCDDCMAGLGMIDPDGDGDVDIIPSLDYDHDGGAGGDGSGNGTLYLAAKADIERMVVDTINATLKPIIQRFNAIGASQMQQNTNTHGDVEITRRIQEMGTKHREELTNVQSLLSDVKGLVERIAATPQQGAVVVNSAAMRQNQQINAAPDMTSIVAEMARAGKLSMQQQIDLGMLLQRQGVIGQ